jgi:thioredoxin-like negative regulator of GroEL
MFLARLTAGAPDVVKYYVAQMVAIRSKWQLQNALAEAGQRVVCVKFTASRCGPCNKIQPELERLEEEHRNNFVVYTADADVATELVDHFRIVSLPTFVFIWRNKVVYTVKGADPSLLQVTFEIMNGMLQ